MAAPCNTDRRSKLGNIAGCVNIRVQPGSARTGEAMLNPFSDFPTHTARLAGVCGADIRHHETSASSLVGYKVLQLSEGPTMQASAYPPSGPDVVSDVGQVFESNLSSPRTDRLNNDSFADFMVDVLYVPLFAPRDSAELTLSCSTTVGLETTTVGKMNVALMAQGTTTKHLASAGSGDVVFSDINTHGSACQRRSIWDIKHQIKVPNSFTNDDARFFRDTRSEQVSLMVSADERDNDASVQREKTDCCVFKTVSPFVEIDGVRSKLYNWNWLVFDDPAIGLQGSVSIGYTMHGLANHLAPQFRDKFADGVVAQVVQGYPVPCASSHDDWRNFGARATERSGQLCQAVSLFQAGHELQGDGALTHIGNYAPEAAGCQGGQLSEVHSPSINARPR